jgi:hypothetical protein
VYAALCWTNVGLAERFPNVLENPVLPREEGGARTCRARPAGCGKLENTLMGNSNPVQ